MSNFKENNYSQVEFAAMNLQSTEWIQLFKGSTSEIVNHRGEWAKAKNSMNQPGGNLTQLIGDPMV